MARVTIEDCLRLIQNRYKLVHLCTARARQIIRGSRHMVESENGPIVTALREIAEDKVRFAIQKEPEPSNIVTAKSTEETLRSTEETLRSTEETLRSTEETLKEKVKEAMEGGEKKAPPKVELTLENAPAESQEEVPADSSSSSESDGEDTTTH